MADSQTIFRDPFFIRFQPPELGVGNGSIWMIHGWTGDENSMWIFSSILPSNHWLIAPRGILPTPEGGYGWTRVIRGQLTHFQDFLPAAQALLDYIPRFQTEFGGIQSPVHLIGFSQGAALAYVLAILKPDVFRRVACMAGFLPSGAEQWIKTGQFSRNRFFIAHGNQDEIIAFSHGHHAATVVEKMGAETTFCEDNIGHKLSKACFASLEDFFQKD